MIDMLIILGYVTGFVFTYRAAYVRMDEAQPAEDKEDRAFNATGAIFLGSMWPVVIVGYAIYRILTPVTPREKAAELEAREKRIDQLERELGLGPYKGES
jgi:hypothetical protein